MNQAPRKIKLGRSVSLEVAPVVKIKKKNLLPSIGDIRDMGSIPRLGRPPGVGNGKSLLYSCLKNSRDRGTWWAIVIGLQSRT